MTPTNEPAENPPCPKCGGVMVDTGITYTTYPSYSDAVCEKCGFVVSTEHT